MLYKLFKFLLYFTVKGYFRSIYVKGKEFIPAKGPVIFAANHNSAFMDPILLGLEINRNLSFLARGDVFKNKIAAFFFSRVNMIPVYQADHDPNDMVKNDAIFEKCFAHLANKKAILIFPEGTSRTERKLRPIKTGTARICLGAENQNDFALGVQIVPIGINYSNPHHFKSDVFINFGEPILVKEYQKQFEADNWDGVLQLTERLKTELEKLVIIVEDERLGKIIEQIEILYRSKLRDESKPHEKAPQDFYLSKDIVKAVQYYAEHLPEELLDFERKIDDYLRNLKRLKIRDTQVRSSKIPFNYVWFALYFVFTFPLFLFGFAGNFLPFKTAEFASKKITVREDFIGSLKLASGLFIFLILYILESLFIRSFTNNYIALGFLLSLYPAGMFTVSYIKNYYKMRGTFKYIRLFIKKSDLIAELKTTRKELVATLERGKKLYVEKVK